MADNQIKHVSIWRKIVPWAGLLLALPFFGGACVLGWQESHLPRELRMFAGPLILEARFFAIGFAVSLFATVIALTTKSIRTRLASTGAIVSGIALIASGYTMERVIEQSFWSVRPSLLPFMIPGVLYVYSFWLLITAAKLKKAQTKILEKDEVIEEQLQPLSRP